MSYTPGPWKVTKLLRDGIVVWKEGYEIRTPDYDVAAWVQHGAPIRKEADARLIAAAPDLLEACEAANETWNDNAPGPGLTERQAIAKLQAAIRKARGEE